MSSEDRDIPSWWIWIGLLVLINVLSWTFNWNFWFF